MRKLIGCIFIVICTMNCLAQVPVDNLAGRWIGLNNSDYYWQFITDPGEIDFRNCSQSSTMVAFLFRSIGGTGNKLNTYCVDEFIRNRHNDYEAIVYDNKGIQIYKIIYDRRRNLSIISVDTRYYYNEQLSFVK